MGKTNFNMQLTDTEKEIMDFVTDVIYADFGYSKADVVSALFRSRAIDYLVENPADGFEEEFFGASNMSDESLMVLLKQKKREEDKALIYGLGVIKYRSMIEKFKTDYPNNDCSLMEELLEEVEKELEGKDNE